MKNGFTNMPAEMSDRSKLKFGFIFAIALIYTALFVGLQNLQAPTWWDEQTFWLTTQRYFSDSLFPSLETLKSYPELNTPLPFIIYGALEYLFQGGLFAGRLLNFCLSIIMVLVIGWPRRPHRWVHVLAVIGLLLFPYYLWLSGRFYTDIIATFFVFWGFFFYFRNAHLLSGLAFVLGIASRQYMLAFPLAVGTYELITSCKKREPLNFRVLMPLLAAATIIGWFVLFGGIAPSSSFDSRLVPDVQRSLFALEPGGALYFLAFVGLYFVIPEWLLFWRRLPLAQLRQRQLFYGAIALGLLGLFLLFPPALEASGNLMKVADLMPFNILKYSLFYSLALLACWRFSKLNLATWIVIFNSLIMIKAWQWDRYALPLMVVLWYLKSIEQLDRTPALSDPIAATDAAEAASN
ncbi:hypothetical protein [Almyronema epifaneia]|uniref:Glycosyltransferase RgtA/B/C/D-like domain-containing protein n=1 Tax=Almyronema epifaneia S1 TaxID=2991925 RepID=A0ABW6I926_9CYAN